MFISSVFSSTIRNCSSLSLQSSDPSSKWSEVFSGTLLYIALGFTLGTPLGRRPALRSATLTTHIITQPPRPATESSTIPKNNGENPVLSCLEGAVHKLCELEQSQHGECCGKSSLQQGTQREDQESSCRFPPQPVH